MSRIVQNPAAFRPVMTAQPQVPVGIDWGNSITRGLSAAIIDLNGQHVELITQQVFPNGSTRVNKPQSFSGNVGSIGYFPAGSILARATPADSIVGNWTAFAETIPTGDTAVANYTKDLIVVSGDESNMHGFGLGTDQYDAINNVCVTQNGTAGRTVSSSYIGAGVNNYSHRVAAVYNGSNFSFYRNGGFVSSSAYTTNPTANANRRLNLARRPAYGSTTQNGIGIVFIWNRALSAQEIKSLSDNPWQIFTPISRPYHAIDLVRGPVQTRQSYLLGTTPEAARTISPAILRKRVMTEQPQYAAQIDWSNPITRGLSFALTPDGLAGNSLVQPYSNSASKVATKRGIAYDYASTRQTQFPHKPEYALTGAMTLVVGCEARALTNYSALISKGASPAVNLPFEFRLGSNGTSSGLSVSRASAADGKYFQVTNSNLFSTGIDELVAVTYPDGIITSTPTFYYGNLGGTITSVAPSISGGTGTGNCTDNGGNFYVGRRGDGVTQLDGVIYFAYGFNRALSHQEIKSLSDNPWQIFLAPNQQPWVAA